MYGNPIRRNLLDNSIVHTYTSIMILLTIRMASNFVQENEIYSYTPTYTSTTI